MSHKQRVLLIRPYRNQDTMSLMPPLGMLYIAAYLRRHGDVDVRIIDMSPARLAYEDLHEQIAAHNPDWLGISALTFESDGLHRVAKIAKQVRPDMPVVVGGPHPSAYTDKVMEDPNVDYAIIGEGEIAAERLGQALRDGGNVDDIEGLAWRENGSVRINPHETYIEDLDALPFPAWDLIDIPAYKTFDRMSRSGVHDYMVIFTTRACPFKCLYCHKMFGKGFRKRSPESVLAEIRKLHDEFGVRELEIIDDIFNCDLPRAKQIFDMIIASGMKLRLTFPNGVRGDHMDEEFLAKARQAGVVFMAFAVETASPRLQKKLKKNIDLVKIKRNISLALKYGIFCHGFFMLGFPTETREELLATSNFALESDLHTANIFVVNPYEGTGLAEWAREIGRPVLTDFERNYFSKEFVNLTEVSDEELNRIRKRTVRKFFLNPRRAYRTIRDLPSKANFFQLAFLALKRMMLRSTG